MLFVVLMPIVGNNHRRVVFIKARSYREVREQLNLPMSWRQWVCVTEKQVETIMLSPEHHHSELMELTR